MNDISYIQQMARRICDYCTSANAIDRIECLGCGAPLPLDVHLPPIIKAMMLNPTAYYLDGPVGAQPPPPPPIPGPPDIGRGYYHREDLWDLEMWFAESRKRWEDREWLKDAEKDKRDLILTTFRQLCGEELDKR